MHSLFVHSETNQSKNESCNQYERGVLHEKDMFNSSMFSPCRSGFVYACALWHSQIVHGC